MRIKLCLILFVLLSDFFLGPAITSSRTLRKQNPYVDSRLVHFEVDDFLPHIDSDDAFVRYKRNSKPLVVRGAQDEDETRKVPFTLSFKVKSDSF